MAAPFCTKICYPWRVVRFSCELLWNVWDAAAVRNTAPINKICRRAPSEQQLQTGSCHEWNRWELALFESTWFRPFLGQPYIVESLASDSFAQQATKASTSTVEFLVEFRALKCQYHSIKVWSFVSCSYPITSDVSDAYHRTDELLCVRVVSCCEISI